MFHKLIDFNGIMVLVTAMNGQTQGAYQATVFAVGVNAYKSGVLFVGVAVVGFDELLEGFLKGLQVNLNAGHNVDLVKIKRWWVKRFICLLLLGKDYVTQIVS